MTGSHRNFGDEEVFPKMAKRLPITPIEQLPGDPWEPLVVTPREACRMLSIGLTQLYELLHNGDLESYRDGGSRRITVSSIRAYVEHQIAISPVKWKKPG
jgi:excisionase family DNA binding protein